MKIDVVYSDETFRGMSYGEWISVWNNWLFSEEPDTYDGGNMLFLRGNINYRPIGDTEGGPRHIDPQGLYDRTGTKGERIFEGTSIFFPVIDAMARVGDLYDGRVLKTMQEIRYAANKDINEGGPMWATIAQKDEGSTFKIVNDLKDFRMESPIFKLTIPENSFLNNRTEVPALPGDYDAVSVGYFLLIRSLPPATYRINFGGKGRGIYHTNSVIDIYVEKKRKDQVEDKSNASTIFTQKWIEP